MHMLILLQPHTHAGKSYAKGDTLRVDAATQAWLETHNIAKLSSTSKANIHKKSIEESTPVVSSASTISQIDEKGEH